jgi:hypothetical protein
MAKHSSKLSHRLIEVADLFVLDDHAPSRPSAKPSKRSSSSEEDSNSDEVETELARV